MATRTRLKELAGVPVKRLRRALFPAYEPLLQGIEDLQAEQRSLRERLDMTLKLAESAQPRAGLEERLRALEEGLHEARRLNLRIAELTDVVTELVLPLHDREIDPERLARLAPDTL